jgi:hypothetical protein
MEKGETMNKNKLKKSDMIIDEYGITTPKTSTTGLVCGLVVLILTVWVLVSVFTGSIWQ